MPETRPQPEDHEHHWLDITRLGSPDYEHLCTICSAYMIKPYGEWPLYPQILTEPSQLLNYMTR